MRFTIVILGLFFGLRAAALTTESADDEALIQAAEQLVADANMSKIERMSEKAGQKTAEASAESPVDAKITAETKESEIPVQLTAIAKPKEPTNIMWRLAASFGFLSIVAGVLYYATRRWTKPKEAQAKGARIEMLHQYHMGPRRSVALIRVAGETILIGVTDQAVNMLKPVTLIDDEIEGLMKKDFNNFLEDEFSIEDVRSALRA